MNNRVYFQFPFWAFLILVSACTKPPLDLVDNGKGYARLVQVVNERFQTETMVNRENADAELLDLMKQLEIYSVLKQADYIWFRGKDGMSVRTSYYYYFGDGEFQPPFEGSEKSQLVLSGRDQSGLTGQWFRVVDDPF